ncbi:MAG: hypothetical protein QM730_23875 [Anaerolineales bacterium]
MNTQPHVQSGLRTSGVFAQKPMLGLTMFLVGSFIFGIVAYNLGVNESLAQWDMTIAKLFRTIQKDARWNWMENLLFGCFIGKELVVVIAAILTAYFLHKRFWRELTMLLLGVGGGGLIWYFLSHFLIVQDLSTILICWCHRDHLSLADQLCSQFFAMGCWLMY